MWIFCAFCEQGKEGGLFAVPDGHPNRCPDCGKSVKQEGVTMSPLTADFVEDE